MHTDLLNNTSSFIGEETPWFPGPSYHETLEILAPLNPVLHHLVLLRKQLAQRMLQRFRKAQQQVLSGSVGFLPYSYEYVDMIPVLRFDPHSNPYGAVEERAVTLAFSLWDKRSWVLAHQDRYSKATIGCARRGEYAYSNKRNACFVQFHGPSQDLLWFGDLVEHNLLRMLQPYLPSLDEESAQRHKVARDYGFPYGCHSSRSGLLDSGDRWFSENARRGELVFEPEALYRGVLYGAALAILILSGGLTVSELVQVSAGRWIVQQTVRATNDDLSNISTAKPVLLQTLLPNKARTEDERSLYSICPEAGELLEEIRDGLVQVHGSIPVVDPYAQIKQSPLLQPERFLFQWGASLDGRGIICPHDLTLLVRFVLYGLQSPHVGRIHITSELLRESSSLPELQREREFKRLGDLLLAPLKDLTPSSMTTYQQLVYEYLRFAGSEEQAFQPETLRRWIAHLRHRQQDERSTSRSTADAIDHKVTPVRRCMAAAGQQGLLDEARSKAFEQIRIDRTAEDTLGTKRGPKGRRKGNESVKQWLSDQQKRKESPS